MLIYYFNQNGLHNNMLKSGTPYTEYVVFIYLFTSLHVHKTKSDICFIINRVKETYCML